MSLTLLTVVLTTSTAHAKDLDKVITKIDKAIDQAAWAKCEKVTASALESSPTDAQRARLSEQRYECAVRSGSLPLASEHQVDSAAPEVRVAHAKLALDAGEADRAVQLLEPLLDGGELPEGGADVAASALAQAGQIDRALELASSLGDAAKVSVARGALLTRRARAAKDLLDGACEAGDEACAELAKSADALVALMDLPRPEGAPEILPTAVHRVRYDGKAEPVMGGNAFAVHYGDGAPVVVTLLSLFGPRMGLPAQLTPTQVGNQLGDISFPHDAIEDRWTPSRMLDMPGTSVTQQMSVADMAAFEATPTAGVNADVLELGAEDPDTGESLWIVAPGAGPDAQRFLHAGVVRQIGGDGLVEIKMTDTIELAKIAGAPTVDAEGHVVGIVLGGGMAGPMTVALATPVSTMRSHLDGE